MNADEATEKMRRQIVDALDRLPNTSTGVATYFAEVGIRGLEVHGSMCPVAQYLKAEVTPAPEFICVAHDITASAGLLWGSGLARVDVPEHVEDFMREFDCGLYPFLVERDAQ